MPTSPGYLFDPIRKREVKATPEEKVRQAILAYLMESLRVPANLIGVEYLLSPPGAQMQKFADIAVWKPGQGEKGLLPWLLVECKRPSISLTGSIHFQASRYISLFPAQFIWLTNGNDNKYFKLTEMTYLPISSLPLYTV